MADADCIRSCAYCGGQNERSARSRYCSPTCKHRQCAEVRRAKPKHACSVHGCADEAQFKGLCHSHLYRIRTYGDPLGKAAFAKQPHTCKQCGKAYKFDIRKNSHTCSRACASAYRIGKRPVYCCEGCGLEFFRKARPDDAVRFCGRECAFAVKSMVRRERLALMRIGERNGTGRKAAKGLRPTPAHVLAEIAGIRRLGRATYRPTLKRGSCRLCSATVITGLYSFKPTCAACQATLTAEARRRQRQSPARRAAKKMEKSIRRMKERTAAERIDPLAVFARDKWKCRLCGVKTPQRLRGSYEPNAPELDHIIPLAIGGEHTWANVQCACRRCNGLKGAKAQGQLGLPGMAA